MLASTATGITLAELQRILSQAEPAALLVPPRILRRVIKQDRRLGGLGLQVPHRKSYALDRDAVRAQNASHFVGNDRRPRALSGCAQIARMAMILRAAGRAPFVAGLYDDFGNGWHRRRRRRRRC